MANCTYTIDNKIKLEGVEGLKAWLVNGGLESLYPDGSWVQAKESESANNDVTRLSLEEANNLIKQSPNNLYSTSSVEDWGTSRGQGKRMGSKKAGGVMVVGAMSNAVTGKKTYTDILGKLKESEPKNYEELNGFEQYRKSDYAKARAAGFDHDYAFSYMIRDDVGNWMESAKEYKQNGGVIAKEPANTETKSQQKQQRFASFDEALNDAERELRRLAKDTEQDGDVLLGNGKFVSFDDALRIVKEGIEEGGLKPVPFQVHDRLDISMRDVDRLLAVANSVKYSKGQSSGSTVEQVKSWLPRNVRKMLDAGRLRVVQSVDDLPANLRGVGDALFHAAWHGSPNPNVFDRFDLGYVGKGQGQSSYGYGVNITSSEKLAKYYQGQYGGHRYNLDAFPREDAYLEWDTPIGKQSDFIKEKLANMGYTFSPSEMANVTGRKIYGDLVKKFYQFGRPEIESKRMASEELLRNGIPGTKWQNRSDLFVDGKPTGRGVTNFVVFNPNDLTIRAVYSKLSGIQGLYDNKSDTVYLVADMLDNGNLNAVLSHELFHKGLATDSKLKAAFNRFLNDMQSRFDLAAKGLGSKSDIDAYNRVIAAETPIENQLEEFAAYQITAWMQNPDSISGAVKKAIQDFIAAIRAFLVRSGLDFGYIQSLTPADLAAMSKYGARVQSNSVFNNNEQGEKMNTAKASAKAQRFYSALKRAFIAAPNQAFGKPEQLKAWINGNASKYDVKKDEIYWSGLNDWLDMQTGKVSREDVINYLEQNGVQVEDVVLGDKAKISDALIKKVAKDLKGTGYEPYYDKPRDQLIYKHKSGMFYDLVAFSDLPNELQDKLNYLDNGIEAKHNNAKLTLPGGTDYRELVVTIPTTEKFNESDRTHFGDVGKGKQIAWIRHNTRTDADGNTGLFLEEVQSQRSQKGREKGFRKTNLKELPEEYSLVSSPNGNWGVFDSAGKRVIVTDNKEDTIKKALEKINASNSLQGIPPAPFVTDNNNKATNAYISLLLKKAVSQAIDDGKSFVAWTTGDQQAYRYDLSKMVESIDVEKTPSGRYRLTITEKGKSPYWAGDKEANELPDFIGKDLAEKAITAADEKYNEPNLAKLPEGYNVSIDRSYPDDPYTIIPPGQIHAMPYAGRHATKEDAIDAALNKLNVERSKSVQFSGLDLKVGGNWTQAMYGNEKGLNAQGKPSLILQAANDIARKFGGEIGSVELLTGKDWNEQPALIITPQMRDKILNEGMPLFSMVQERNNNIRYSKADHLADLKRAAGLGPKKTLSDSINDIIKNGVKGNVQVIKDKWQELKPQLEQGLFDKFIGIKRAEREILGEVASAVSGYVGARLSTGSSSTMAAVIQFGSPVWRDGVVSYKDGTKGFADMLRPVKDDLENFTAYMVAKRAERLKGEGRENLFTIDMIKAGLALENDTFKQVAKDIAALNKDILDFAQASGLIDAESRKVWESDDYIPFYRIVEGMAKAPRSKGGLSHQSSGIRMLKGGENPLSDPLGNMMMNWAHLIDASMKNDALNKTLKNLEGSRFVDNVPRVEFKQALIPKNQIKKLMLESGLPKEVVDAMPDELTDGIAKMWAMQAPSDPDIVRVMREGKTEYYRVNDAMLLTSLTAVNQAPLGGIFKQLRAFKSLLTSAVTADPTFMARNFVRDSMHSWTIAEEKGFKLGIDSIHGAVKTFKEEGGFIDMMFAGASFQGGYGGYNNPETARETMDSYLRKKGIKDIRGFKESILDTPKKYFEMYRAFGDAIENASREAILENAKRAGKEKAEYLYEAKDLMDFSLQGSFAIVRALSDMLPFFNARLQGLYRLGRAGKTKEATRLIVMKGATMAALSLALLALNSDNDDYEALEDWDKDQYWHFFVGDKHFRLPKPFELGLVFGTIPERSARALFGVDSPKEFATRMGHAASDTLAFNPIPQAFRPLVELYANTDMFTNRPIENMADEGKLPSARYNEQTSETMRKLSEWLPESLGASPKRLEHLVHGYTGAMGMYVLGASDMLARRLAGMPEEPSSRLDKLPVIKAFYQEKPQTHTKYGTEFYDMLREVEQVYRTVNAYKKEGRFDKAQELAIENADKLQARKSLAKGNKRLSEIRKQIDVIYRSNMSAEDKRSRIDNAMSQTNELVRKIVERNHPYFKK